MCIRTFGLHCGCPIYLRLMTHILDTFDAFLFLTYHSLDENFSSNLCNLLNYTNLRDFYQPLLAIIPAEARSVATQGVWGIRDPAPPTGGCRLRRLGVGKNDKILCKSGPNRPLLHKILSGRNFLLPLHPLCRIGSQLNY